MGPRRAIVRFYCNVHTIRLGLNAVDWVIMDVLIPAVHLTVCSCSVTYAWHHAFTWQREGKKKDLKEVKHPEWIGCDWHDFVFMINLMDCSGISHRKSRLLTSSWISHVTKKTNKLFTQLILPSWLLTVDKLQIFNFFFICLPRRVDLHVETHYKALCDYRMTASACHTYAIQVGVGVGAHYSLTF